MLRAVVELARELPVSRSAVSHHLRVLKDAGLVATRAEGTRRIYAAGPDGLAELRAQRTSIVVDAPGERAFRVFTDDFDRIKPREHNMLEIDIAETVFEARVGGRIFDRGVDGSECQWARGLAFEPPDRVVFSWDISPRWQIETDLEKGSEVEVRFVAETPERTRVELEHRHLDRHGAGWEGARDGVGGEGGWPLYLERFAGVVG